ncbi:hypothetical protein COCSUDRAFT_48251 [Coccomyxa subellipsoidea C-169]|uniref:Uncharacterized protein n=1 Tax=Coccomyxa subellipsoidea (strain C-169) TaxID=574566 RepID=I0YRN3_COCSC|nr:hypothetical protein COCSUDRAFT_48251 [Coccomyxa subellipsoidea C-169]EIE21052.1 hypothetical protein COCSUDRAFT_48251 [Coccomyxa subellipsoidea C-169]|eukprot:XP_005645596.1 hypothetical protein COCSUDRAFT_48251 [Coccomyxa subellipsoidea C-169]
MPLVFLCHFAGLDLKESSSEIALRDAKFAVNLSFGEAAVQLQMTREDVIALTIDGLAQIWKTLVQKMGLNLDMMGAAPTYSCVHQRRVEKLVHEAIAFMWALVDYNQQMLSAITTINVEAPAKAQPFHPSKPRDWPAILARMQLSDGQVRQLLRGRRTLVREVGALIAQWDQLWTQLQSIKDVDEGPGSPRVANLTEQLRANVHALFTCRAFYLSWVYNRVFSPVQTARYLTASYPIGPDTLSLLTCLAQRYDEPSTTELMRVARPGTAAGADLRAPLCGSSATVFGGGGGSTAAFGAGGASSTVVFPVMDSSAAACGGGYSSSAASGGPGDWRQALEKQQATERQLLELSEKAAALELERDQLQRAVETATSDSQVSCTSGKSGDEKPAVSFCFGEATTQLQLTHADIRSLTVEAMADIWKTVVHKLTSCLAKMDAAPKDKRCQSRIEEMMYEAHLFLWALVHHKPSLLRALGSCNMEDPTGKMSSNGRNWPAILARMQLSEKQEEQLVAVRRTLLREVGALISEWDQLWAELQSIKHLEQKAEGSLGQYSHYAGLTERLRVNVMSAVQAARYMTACYPMGPDTLCLMTCLAQQANEPATGELMCAARPRTAAPGDEEPAVAFCFGEAALQLLLTKGEVRALTVETMAEIWKRLVQRMALSLDNMDATPRDTRLLHFVKDIVHEAIAFLWALVLYKPSLLRVINTCNMEAPTAKQTCATRDWPAILARMQLTEAQAQQLLAVRRALLNEVGALIAEWDRQWAELQSVKHLEEMSEDAVSDSADSARVSEQLPGSGSSLNACRAFAKSTDGNSLETTLLMSYKVLSPVQLARYLVGSYPMGPDTLSLMTCLAQQANEPATKDLMRAARPPTDVGPQDMDCSGLEDFFDPFYSALDWCFSCNNGGSSTCSMTGLG